jgi:hypothetical protein
MTSESMVHNKLCLSHFYDYYVSSIVSGGPFGEDLQIRLKNELENLGKKYLFGAHKDIMNEKFSSMDHFFKEMIRDLDSLFESWGCGKIFATRFVGILEEQRGHS